LKDDMDLSLCRIMVTGGAGFLGSALCAHLRHRGCRQIFVPRSAQYDLRTESGVVKALEKARPDVVFHLAARVGGIGANLRNPGSFFYDNALMGIHVIEHCRQRGTQKVIVAGTICAYPKHTPVPFREDSLWDGYPEETNAPYGLAKKMLLVQCQSYRLQYGLNCIYPLVVNLYGPGDNFDLDSSHVIPAMIRKFCEARDNEQKTVVLWGDGSPTRELLHVGDAASGLVLAAEHYDSAEPVNLGNGQEVCLHDLAQLIARLTSFKGEIVWDESRPNGQPRRCLDTRKAEEWFGFKARVPLEVGLRDTIRWYEHSATNTLQAA
jgi:GDP-L-fucose synthase